MRFSWTCGGKGRKRKNDQHIQAPAETLMSCPVIMDAALEHKKATTSAMEDEGTKVFSGEARFFSRSTSSKFRCCASAACWMTMRWRGPSTAPGQTVLTRTFHWPHSRASERVRPMMAALAEQ